MQENIRTKIKLMKICATNVGQDTVCSWMTVFAKTTLGKLGITPMSPGSLIFGNGIFRKYKNQSCSAYNCWLGKKNCVYLK